jgi:steroid delta-isomerase-like uncharacterized protein
MRAVDAHRAAHEEWNKRDFDGIADRTAEQFQYTDHARGMSFKSRDEWMEWVKAWAEALPDGKVVDPQYTDAGNVSIARFTGRGTNDGPFGFLPATGKKVSFDLCEIMEVDDSGRFVRGEMYYDQLGILVQLGHIEAPQA